MVYPRSEVIEEADVTSSFLLAKLDHLEHYDRQSLVVKLPINAPAVLKIEIYGHCVRFHYAKPEYSMSMIGYLSFSLCK